MTINSSVEGAVLLVMRLSARFALLVGALMLAVALSCGAGAYFLSRMNASVETVVDRDVRRVIRITSVRKLFRSMGVLERDHLLAEDRATAIAAEVAMGKARAALDAELAKYLAIAPREEKASIDALRGTFERWVALDDQVLALSRTGARYEAFALARAHAADPIAWEPLIAGLVKANEDRLEAHVVSTAALHRKARRVLFCVSALAAFVGFALGAAIFVGIRRNVTEIVALNASLEQRVADRTATLESRERSTRLVLENIDEGLFLIDLEGRLVGERSSAATSWFGEPAAEHQDVASYLFPDDEPRRAAFAMGFRQIARDVLPFEVGASNMPATIVRGDSTYELSFRQVMEGGAFAKVLLITTDVTARIAAERAGRDARERQAIMACVMRDKAGFLSCIGECEQLIADAVSERDLVVLKRGLHTLKANAAIFGCQSVVERCDELEDRIADEGLALSAEEGAKLIALWRTRLESVEEFLIGAERSTVEVEATELQELLAAVRAHRDYEEVEELVASWRWGRTAEQLLRLRAEVERIARSLDKSVTVDVEPHALRIPPGFLDRFWPTLVHVIRNAVDHGVESTEHRLARGKSPRARISLETTLEEGTFVVRIADDGAGLNEEELAAKARALGLCESDPVDAIFVDGLSTRAEVSAVSGRGVGLGAVRFATIEAGGTVAVRSRRGEGTCFEFRFPWPFLAGASMAGSSHAAAA